MDVLTKEQRHKVMSHIRSKDTSIEVKLRKALWQKGYRYRKNYKALPGTPDIVLTKQKIAIFCDSEFFHGKDWCTILRPRIRRGNNAEFWEKKILRNMDMEQHQKKLKIFAKSVERSSSLMYILKIFVAKSVDQLIGLSIHFVVIVTSQ